MINHALHVLKSEKPKPKVYQHEGKRVSVRLEPAYIRALSQISKNHGFKQGALVHMLKKQCDGPNFSSFLRSFCMIEMERSLLFSPKQNAKQNDLQHRSFTHALFKQAPAPAFLMNESLIILDYNAMLKHWCGESFQTPIDTAFQDFFDITSAKPMRLLLKELNKNKRATIIVPVRYKNFKASAQISMIALEEKTYYFVWLRTAPTSRPPRIVKILRKNN